MSDENNKRYIGEVFIDGKSDRLLQEFLTNLFNSYNGPGKGFNADMLDNWHLEQILDHIDERVNTKLGSITIGQTTFTREDFSKYLQLNDIIYDIDWIPWAQPIIDKDGHYGCEDSSLLNGENYLASDIIIDLYRYLNSIKADQEDFIELKDNYEETADDYQSFKENFDGLIREVEIVDKNGNTTTRKFFNAQLINGYRIIPITQTDYDALDDKMKHFWRHIYIIVDEVPDDYMDPISYELLSNVEIVFNPQTQYIEYYDGISGDPIQLISLQDLLSGADLSSKIRDFIENTNDIVINSTSLKESLKQFVVNSDEADEFPFLTNTALNGLVDEIKSDYGTINTTKTNLLETKDITHAFDNKFNDINNQFSSVSNDITRLNNELRAYMGSTFLTATQVGEIFDSLNNKLTSLQTKVNQVNNKVDKRYYQKFLNLGGPYFGNSYTSSNRNGVSFTIRDNIGIFVFNNPVLKCLTDGWCDICATNKGLYEVESLDQNYYSNLVTNVGVLTRARVTSDGRPQVYVEKDWINKSVGFGWGQITFPASTDRTEPNVNRI